MANDLIQRKYYIVDTEDSLPSEIVDGSIYYVKSNNALYIDMSSTRRRINPDYSNKLDANQGYINAGKSLSIDDNGNIIPVENINIDPTLKNQGQAADAKITGQALGELYDYFEGLQQIVENLDDSTTVTTDTTLSNQGVPADAKATGDRLTSIQSELNVLEPTATASDVGKTLKVKTVANGKVSKYELGDMMIDNTLTQSGWAADAKKVGSELSSVKDEVRNESQARTTADNALREDINDDLAQIQAQISSVYGAPSTASTVAQMTDHTKAYVYTGEESGYVTGNWYYWNGSSWVSGGVYNAVAIQTDKSLTLDGKAADAKTVGDELNDLKADLEQVTETVQGTREVYTPLEFTLESKTATQNGLTIVQNTNGTVHISGTASALTLVYFTDSNSNRLSFDLINGETYRLRGCPNGGSDNTYRLDLRTSSSVILCTDYGNGYVITISAGSNTYYPSVRIPSGATVDIVVLLELAIRSIVTGNILSAVDLVAREDSSGAVRFDIVQDKTDEEKARARENIGAGSNEVSISGYHPDYPFGVITDKDGHVILTGGNPKISGANPLKGKTVSILGDSISTYNGWIVSGRDYYYPKGDVDSVDKTWWKRVIDRGEMTLCNNASWGGTGLCIDYSQRHDAFGGASDARISELANPTTSASPDIILIYISTNDWSVGKEIGNFDSTMDVPSDGNVTEITTGYAMMLYKIRQSYPNATVFCLLQLNGRHHANDTTYPYLNGVGESIYQLNQAETEIAHMFSAEVIDLGTCGVHPWNIQNYMADTTYLHPNNAGMIAIADAVYKKLLDYFS